MIRGIGRLLGAPARWWSRSLSFKLVSSSVLATSLILAITGLFLIGQTTKGIMDAKTASAVESASDVMRSMQSTLAGGPLEALPFNEAIAYVTMRLDENGGSGEGYEVLVVGPGADLMSSGVDPSTVRADMRRSVADDPLGIFAAPTLLRYTDGRPSHPGLVVGATLHTPAGRVPLFFIHGLQQEQEIVNVVERSALIMALIFVPTMALVTYLISLSVLRPVRLARLAAERIAAGHFDERLSTRAEDDIAGLSRSMNHMGTELSRKIRELQDLSLVQRQFVSDVSHELRTPLTTVRMAADMMMEGRDQFDVVTRRSVELLNRELDRFEGLLTDLLEISRFDAGAAELALEDINLVELVQIEIDAQQGLAERYRVELVLDSPEKAMVQCDQRRVRRIVSNLLSNAIEHGEARPVSVHVRATDEAVAVAVRDRGVGFTATQAHQVFTRFWRADPSRNRTVGGNGLGLSIALEDAQLHGGWLNAWGRPGQGAQFRLTLPREAHGRLVKSPWPVVPPREEDQ